MLGGYLLDMGNTFYGVSWVQRRIDERLEIVFLLWQGSF